MGEMVRLIFEYRDGAFVPLTPQTVRMIAPHPPVTRGDVDIGGRFVELRSADGTAVQSVRVGEAGPPMVEFPTGDPEQPFGRAEPPSGTVVTVVVEDDERATRAFLVDVPAPSDRELGAPSKRDLADVQLPGRGDQ